LIFFLIFFNFFQYFKKINNLNFFNKKNQKKKNSDFFLEIHNNIFFYVFKIVEIPALTEHLLHECEKKSTMVQCDLCMEAIPETEFALHQQRGKCRSMSFFLSLPHDFPSFDKLIIQLKDFYLILSSFPFN